VVVPSQRAALAWIAGVLEENDREDFIRMKIARESPSEGGAGQ